jgi:hypothetical protein
MPPMNFLFIALAMMGGRIWTRIFVDYGRRKAEIPWIN